MNCIKCTGDTVENGVCRNCGHTEVSASVLEKETVTSTVKKAIKKITKK